MKNLYILVLVGTLLMQACKNDNSAVQVRENQIETSTDSLFLVRQGPFNFSLLLPKKDLEANLPMIVFKENSGELVVAVGTDFSFKVTQEIRTIEQIQNQLNTSEVFKNEILESNEHSVLSHRFLSDGSHVSYHYSQMIKGPKGVYYAESDPFISFNLEQIKKLQKAIQSIHPL